MVMQKYFGAQKSYKYCIKKKKQTKPPEHVKLEGHFQQLSFVTVLFRAVAVLKWANFSSDLQRVLESGAELVFLFPRDPVSAGESE